MSSLWGKAKSSEPQKKRKRKALYPCFTHTRTAKNMNQARCNMCAVHVSKKNLTTKLKLLPAM